MLKTKFRLPAKARLIHSSSFRSGNYMLKIAKNNLPFSRFGIIIGRKVDNRSVVRNRVKRVFRSCIEEMLQKIVPGYDMLFILSKNAIGKNRDNFYSEIKNTFQANALIN